jgi:hypothetical protein
MNTMLGFLARRLFYLVPVLLAVSLLIGRDYGAIPQVTRNGMRPYVIWLVAASVDGRIIPSRWRPKGGTGSAFEQVHDKLASDAWLVGRVTGQEFAKGKPYAASTQTFPRQNWFARRDAKSYGIVLDADGKIAWDRADIGDDPTSFPNKSRMGIWQACARKGYPTFSPEHRSWTWLSRWTSSIASLV